MTHPLDPLSADEIRQVAALLRKEKGVARPDWRIAAIELREPAKDTVRTHRPGDPVERVARAIVWDTRDGLAYVAVLALGKVSVSDDTLLAWDPQPGRQPNATVDEWHDCDEAMRRHPDVIAALAARGIDDPSLTLVDVWTYGASLIPAPYAGRRIGWCDVWLRAEPGANPYAHPVAGLKLVVDMNAMELLEIQDTGDPGRPEVMGEYAPSAAMMASPYTFSPLFSVTPTTRPLSSTIGPVTSADCRTSAPADSACLSNRVSSSVRLTVCPWSGMPGRFGNDSSHWLGLNTVTRLTR